MINIIKMVLCSIIFVAVLLGILYIIGAIMSIIEFHKWLWIPLVSIVIYALYKI